jgi:ABC-type uncharacterized transport system permease subunit
MVFNILSLLAEVRTGLLAPLQFLPKLLREGPPPPKPGESMHTLPEEVWAESATRRVFRQFARFVPGCS